MITKDKFNELGYELKENWLSNIDLIENDNFTIEINYDKKKIIVFNSDGDSSNEISRELLEILYEYLKEKRFFEDE